MMIIFSQSHVPKLRLRLLIEREIVFVVISPITFYLSNQSLILFADTKLL